MMKNDPNPQPCEDVLHYTYFIPIFCEKNAGHVDMHRGKISQKDVEETTKHRLCSTTHGEDKEFNLYIEWSGKDE